MPRVVTAGVPSRTPLVRTGGSGSKGMPFLLTVIWTVPSASSASRPVTPKRTHIHQHEMIISAARYQPKAVLLQTARPAPAHCRPPAADTAETRGWPPL